MKVAEIIWRSIKYLSSVLTVMVRESLLRLVLMKNKIEPENHVQCYGASIILHK